MQFKFSFEIVKEDKIPLIDVTLTNKDNGRKVSYRALLDSGAFANVFHSDIAKVLGIDLTTIREQELFKGVEKTKRQMKGKPYIIEIMIIQKGYSHKFDSYVIFTDDINEDGFPLLGRQCFFDRFKEIAFNYTNNKVYLKA